jgi:hypothetical protein
MKKCGYYDLHYVLTDQAFANYNDSDLEIFLYKDIYYIADNNTVRSYYLIGNEAELNDFLETLF